MSFTGMSNPSVHSLMINHHLKTRDTFGGDMDCDDAHFLLAPLRENDKSEKLVVKASCEFEHDMIVVSKDSFVEEECSLKETHLEEACDEECVKVIPYDLELVEPMSIEYPLKYIPTSIVLPPSSVFHSSMDPSMSTSLEFESCISNALILDRTHELDMTIGLDDWVEDLGFLPDLCVHVLCETFRPLYIK